MIRNLFKILGTVGFAVGALSSPIPEATAYRLYALDVVSFTVFGEPELSVTLRISGTGRINLPLLGDIEIAGQTLAEAEKTIQERFIDAEILINPQVTLQVREYSAKEISVLGQAGRQGKILLPAESNTMNIVEAITAVGGLSRISKGDSVRITRTDPKTGNETVYVVDVEALIAGKGNREMFYVIPGDVIYVPERLF